MSSGIPEFFNELQRRLDAGTLGKPLLIELDDEWGVSLGPGNPEPSEYHACGSLLEAKNLLAMIEEQRAAKGMPDA